MKMSCRVFVSYSHKNKNEADQVRSHLKNNLGAEPMSDSDLTAGMEFTDEIKRHIAYSHLFIPILTVESIGRPWVNQEIGYAIGLGVPILPLALGRIPEGMVRQIQAVSVSEDLGNLEQELTAEKLQRAIDKPKEIGSVTSQCAIDLLDRTKMIVQYATDVRNLGESGKVRLRSAFGSFTIPKEHDTHPIWNVRDGRNRRTTSERKELRKEREVLEEHARIAGCSMILDPEAVKAHSPGATIVRLEVLVDFLKSMEDDKVSIVFQKGKIGTGLIMIGDWFLAEAIVPLRGVSYRLTVFTRHGATVRERVKDFDCELEGLLKLAGLKGKPSRIYAIDYLEVLIEKLKKGKKAST